MGKTYRALCVLSCVVLSGAGCQMARHEAECGWRFEVMKPPIIHTSTPVLIQGGSGELIAHPLGTVAGPVTEGQFTHAPTHRLLPKPRVENGPVAAEDCRPRLTAEEWLAITSQGRTAPLPVGVPLAPNGR